MKYRPARTWLLALQNHSGPFLEARAHAEARIVMPSEIVLPCCIARVSARQVALLAVHKLADLASIVFADFCKYAHVVL